MLRKMQLITNIFIFYTHRIEILILPEFRMFFQTNKHKKTCLILGKKPHMQQIFMITLHSNNKITHVYELLHAEKDKNLI